MQPTAARIRILRRQVAIGRLVSTALLLGFLALALLG